MVLNLEMQCVFYDVGDKNVIITRLDFAFQSVNTFVGVV